MTAITLRFDDLGLVTSGETQLGVYGGFTWTEAGAYAPDGTNGYLPASGTALAFIAEAAGNEIPGYGAAVAGSPVTISRGEDFSLLAAAFSGAFRDGITVTVRGFDADHALVAETTVDLATKGTLTSATFAGFTGLRSVEINGNDGNAATNDYFGFDDLTFSVDSLAPVTIDTTGYDQTFRGAAGGDRITVNGSGNVLAGASGDDILNALGWNNTIYAGAGNDRINAGYGGASVHAGSGDNIIVAGGWNNLIEALDGNNTVTGPLGNTLVTLGSGRQAVTLQGWGNSVEIADSPTGPNGSLIAAGNGDSAVTFHDGTVKVVLAGWNNSVTGGTGRHDISGSQGDTEVTLQDGAATISLGGWSNHVTIGFGAHNIELGQGNSTLDAHGTNTVRAFGYGNLITTYGGDDVISGIAGWSVVDAGGGDNSITADGWNNTIKTQGGADKVTLTGGGNTVHTGAGDDEIVLGYGGGNLVDAGRGNDIVTGSGGQDTFVLNASGQGVDLIKGFHIAEGDALIVTLRSGQTLDDVHLDLVGGTTDVAVLVGTVEVALLQDTGPLDVAALLAAGNIYA